MRSSWRLNAENCKRTWLSCVHKIIDVYIGILNRESPLLKTAQIQKRAISALNTFLLYKYLKNSPKISSRRKLLLLAVEAIATETTSNHSLSSSWNLIKHWRTRGTKERSHKFSTNSVHVLSLKFVLSKCTCFPARVVLAWLMSDELIKIFARIA